MDIESGNGTVNWFPLTKIVCMLVCVPMLARRGLDRQRLSQFWEARNINKGKKLMSVDMLLIDENFMPPTSVDTSQNHVLRPPVA
ncbi:hypothetical protein YC2023_116322 [Brassica napus]